MFKIEITQIQNEEVKSGKEWKLTGHTAACTCGCKEYAYTPEIIKTKQIERKVYEQTVDNINLEAVILAVNGMPHQNCVH